MSARLRAPFRLAAAVSAALLASVLVASCSGDGDETAVDPAVNTSEPTTSSANTSEPTTSTVACDYPTSGEPAAEVEAPDDQAPDSGTVSAVISLGAGDVDVTLDREATPCTVNSFVSLAEQGYFDGTQCHRLTTEGIYVLQCGDPTGTGAGGPGYSFADELSGDETYPAGTLAMANAGQNTNGSQFFIVYDDTRLNPDYTVFGQVGEAGLKVVKRIADRGVQGGGPDGPPADQVDIESVTIG